MLLATASLAALDACALLTSVEAQTAAASPFGFPELDSTLNETVRVAEGYEVQVLMRWGDPVLPGAPAFDPAAQSADRQIGQWGHNNDYLCFIPLAPSAAGKKRGVLCANHEYCNSELMFTGLNAKDMADFRARLTIDMAKVEMAAIGGSIVEIEQTGSQWAAVPNSPVNRRLHVGSPFTLTGVAAGHGRMRTSADPEGSTALGMLGCCAGGMTPWGTWLAGEENVQQFFTGKVPAGHREADNHKRFGSNGRYGWGLFEPRFNVEKEPNEMNRFGWVVEVDPLDPQSRPRKHTALGRFKHESATVVVNKDGRVVVYSGDDERYECVYRFISKGTFNPADRATNMGLLTEGDLSVARYNDDKTLDWLPLRHGSGPLTAQNGFESQADVLIDARHAAHLLGGTLMDRPEDIEVSPTTGRIYVALTYNERRKPEEVNAANPRANNRFGHIIEMTAPNGDHGADRFAWDMLVQCGDPAKPEVKATFHASTTRDGWFGMPDNLAFDPQGRLWVATDGNEPGKTGRGDGLWGVVTEGPMRGHARHFLTVPAGAECTGPVFTPDGETLFMAVQHPAEDGPSYAPHGRFSSADDPATRWPDFKPGMPPRPSVIAITRKGGGAI